MTAVSVSVRSLARALTFARARSPVHLPEYARLHAHYRVRICVYRRFPRRRPPLASRLGLLPFCPA